MGTQLYTSHKVWKLKANSFHEIGDEGCGTGACPIKQGIKMVNYRSATSKTVSYGQYQVTANPGVELPTEDEGLEALVKEGLLLKNGGTTETPKPVTAVPVKSGTLK